MSDFDKDAMDRAAKEAEKALLDIPDELILPLAKWHRDWYLKAGHKRLGRITVNFMRERDKKSVTTES